MRRRRHALRCEDFAKHFRAKYAGDNPPIWIACELWDFGALSVLFGGMQKRDQTAIAEKYSLRCTGSFKIMESWIRTLNVARNVCAHHCRLWNRPLAVQPKWPPIGTIPDLDHIAGNTTALTRFYATAAIVCFLLRSINPGTNWSTRLKQLFDEFPVSSQLKIDAAGFPSNWKTQPLWG
jgi:abortive infection bacteriophage resistance protein